MKDDGDAFRPVAVGDAAVSAAVTSMELVTGVIILPQRQTLLAAKQAAEVDLLTSGKFGLGVGIGWNRVEYEALGQDFGTRSKRLEEQITLLQPARPASAWKGASAGRKTGTSSRQRYGNGRMRTPRTCRSTPWAPA